MTAFQTGTIHILDQVGQLAAWAAQQPDFPAYNEPEGIDLDAIIGALFEAGAFAGKADAKAYSVFISRDHGRFCIIQSPIIAPSTEEA